VSNPFENREADRGEESTVTPWAKPRKEKKDKGGVKPVKGNPNRDRRWFLRIVGWIVTCVGALMAAFGIFGRDTQPALEEDFMSASQIFLMVAIPLLLSGIFLLWWGYSRFGEPMVGCKACTHINKPRSTTCAKCGASLT
jgi:hypothetical protein